VGGEIVKQNRKKGVNCPRGGRKVKNSNGVGPTHLLQRKLRDYLGGRKRQWILPVKIGPKKKKGGAGKEKSLNKT